MEESLFFSSLSTRNACLYLWQTQSTGAVLGIEKSIALSLTMINVKDNIEIIRRFSGGGTVLQCPGILNYGFIYPLEHYPQYVSLNDSYCLFFKNLNLYFRKLELMLPTKDNRTFA